MSSVTKVVFRVWKWKNESGVIALFPELPTDPYGWYCESYMHVGQHAGADYERVIERTRPATEEEYADLMRELEDIGYNLEVRQHETPQMREKRLERAGKWRQHENS